jgi:Flp pilus assembly protein TadG
MKPTSTIDSILPVEPVPDHVVENTRHSAAPPKRGQIHASRGQIIILLAGAMVAMIGMLGVATDLGYGFAERRTMQNAADAGALAGAHELSKTTTSSPVTVLTEVQGAAWANKIGDSHPTVSSCKYVNDADLALANCSEPAPSTASGIKVVVKETHKTFFMGIIPGGPDTMSTQATATAHVQLLKSPPSDGPFLVCGVGTKVESGPQIPILTQSGSNWVLNPSAVTTSSHNGPTYQIYGPQVATCNLSNSSYKGLALGGSNANLTVPGWFYFSNGDSAGGLAANVTGIQGCTTSQIVNCVAFLPVAVDNPKPDSTTNKMYTVMILPFYIMGTKNGSGNYNKLDGKIMGDYITEGEGQTGWVPGTQNPIVIRLTK